MEGRNRYTVDSYEDIIADYVRSVSVFYLPLIGKRAVCLYLQLVCERENRMECTLERLCTLSHLNIDELEETLKILEEYELIKTLKKDDEYLFLVRSPLSVRRFLEHEVYSRMYLNNVGRKEYEISVSAYLPKPAIRRGYKDVSHSFDPKVMKGWNQDDEDRYQKTQNINPASHVEITFDYARFTRELTNLQFPVSLRTRENMEIIGQLGTVYAVPADKMRELVARSYDPRTGVFDQDALRKRCLACKEVDYQPGENEFDIAPVAYLQHRQGAAVSQADKKMLVNLMEEYRLSNQVINVLIDYVLTTTDNRLDRLYIDKIGATFMRQGIDTVEKAQQALSHSGYEPRKGRKDKPVFSAQEMEPEEQDIQELRRRLFGEENQ